MRFNTENAQVYIYCRETGDQVSFHCGCDLDWDDIMNLQTFFESAMDTAAARELVYRFGWFHDGVNYDHTIIDSTDENARLQKISHQLDVNGYSLFIDGISYE